MAELVDAHGSGPCAFGCGGSSPLLGTKYILSRHHLILTPHYSNWVQNLSKQTFYYVLATHLNIYYKSIIDKANANT